MRRAGLLLVAAACATLGCASSPPPPAIAIPRCTPPPPGEPPERVVDRFYGAFAKKDFATMACSYHPDVEFTDSIFGTLRKKRALAMWAMLLSQPGDLQLQWKNVRADGARASAHWDAQYTFPFGLFHNHVENSIDATFELKDGLIYRHTDRFDLDRWMHTALWPLGGAISQSTIKDGVQVKLNEFIAAHPEFRDDRR